MSKFRKSFFLFVLIIFLSYSCKKEKDIIISSYNNKQVMNYGTCCTVPTPNSQLYKNDVLHPSVLYVNSGFGGHKWWMVQTPYYAGNNKIENPILYYAEETSDGSAPINWISILDHPVVDTPSQGYNSDPDLFYDNGKLWLLWRENGTVDCIKNNLSRAIFGISSIDGINWEPTTKKLFMGAKTSVYDSAMCPILVKEKDKYRVYASNFQFYSCRISHGLAVWEGHDLDNPDFKIQGIYPIKCNKAYQPWHFDILKYNDKYYMILQTNEANANISIGESADGQNFVILPKPLIVQDSRHIGIYKPAAIIKDGIFYLYYSMKDTSDYNHNLLYMTKMLFKSVLYDASDSNYVSTKFTTNIRFKEE